MDKFPSQHINTLKKKQRVVYDKRIKKADDYQRNQTFLRIDDHFLKLMFSTESHFITISGYIRVYCLPVILYIAYIICTSNIITGYLPFHRHRYLHQSTHQKTCIISTPTYKLLKPPLYEYFDRLNNKSCTLFPCSP